MNRLSLRPKQLKFKNIAGKLPIVLEGFIEYTPILESETGGCQYVTGWTCKHKDLNQLLCPKISPITGSQVPHLNCLVYLRSIHAIKDFSLHTGFQVLRPKYDMDAYMAAWFGGGVRGLR